MKETPNFLDIAMQAAIRRDIPTDDQFVDDGRAGVERRFWAKVNKTETCWLWTASTINTGYGQFHATGGRGTVMVLAHRFAYEQIVGPIPAGLQLDHLCRVRRCVNPSHLEPVTPSENALRASRLTRGFPCPRGHVRSPENTSVRPDGSRYCRDCNREQGRERRTALGERSAVVIEGLFSAPAVKARQKARIARSLEQFIGAYPAEIDE